jgi:hypothetical protein
MGAGQALKQAPAAESGPADLAGRAIASTTAPEPRLGGMPFDIRLALLRQHGSFSQAYSMMVQPGLLHFGDERGFIAYKKIWGTAMVLADPVAPPQIVDDLIDRFLREDPDTAFWQISRPLASILAQRGFWSTNSGWRRGSISHPTASRDKASATRARPRAASPSSAM